MTDEIWNKRVDCGSRTYFFDMKETKEGKKYLTLTETRLREGVRGRHRVMIFEEGIAEFIQAINEAAEKFR